MGNTSGKPVVFTDEGKLPQLEQEDDVAYAPYWGQNLKGDLANGLCFPSLQSTSLILEKSQKNTLANFMIQK